jgi:hypothetical protein
MTAESLDLSATIARIDRELAECAELRAQDRKFAAERRKLLAEAYKPARNSWLTPAKALALTGLVSFLAGLNLTARG